MTIFLKNDWKTSRRQDHEALGRLVENKTQEALNLSFFSILHQQRDILFWNGNNIDNPGPSGLTPYIIINGY